MIEFIHHGLAVGLLPGSFVAGHKGIAIVPIRHHAPQFEVAIASPSDRRISAAARALLEAIQQRIVT